MVDYCGWDMPVEYSGITREHLAVRTAAGLFDVSHMGEIEVRGPQCFGAASTRDLQRCLPLAGLPGPIQRPDAARTAVPSDDCVVHRFASDHYFLCVNAANTDKDYAWIVQCNSLGAEVLNVSGAILADRVAGPARAGDPGEGDGSRSGRFEVLLVPPRPLRGRGRHSGAHWLYRARTGLSSTFLPPPPRICGTRYWTRARRKG